jgi:hypothetical protein
VNKDGRIVLEHFTQSMPICGTWVFHITNGHFFSGLNLDTCYSLDVPSTVSHDAKSHYRTWKPLFPKVSQQDLLTFYDYTEPPDFSYEQNLVSLEQPSLCQPTTSILAGNRSPPFQLASVALPPQLFLFKFIGCQQYLTTTLPSGRTSFKLVLNVF